MCRKKKKNLNSFHLFFLLFFLLRIHFLLFLWRIHFFFNFVWPSVTPKRQKVLFTSFTQYQIYVQSWLFVIASFTWYQNTECLLDMNSVRWTQNWGPLVSHLFTISMSVPSKKPKAECRLLGAKGLRLGLEGGAQSISTIYIFVAATQVVILHLEFTQQIWETLGLKRTI